MALFRPKRKSMDINLKIKLNGKQLYETNSVKYLGISIYNKLNRKAHINDIALKLIRANARLYKVRDFLYFKINQIFILQKKALRLIHFKEPNAHTAPLFTKSKIVKLPGKTEIENCLFISKLPFHQQQITSLL